VTSRLKKSTSTRTAKVWNASADSVDRLRRAADQLELLCKSRRLALPDRMGGQRRPDELRRAGQVGRLQQQICRCVGHHRRRERARETGEQSEHGARGQVPGQVRDGDLVQVHEPEHHAGDENGGDHPIPIFHRLLHVSAEGGFLDYGSAHGDGQERSHDGGGGVRRKRYGDRGAAIGMRYGPTSLSAISITVPNAITGRAASHRRAGIRPLREQVRRASRVLAGGPRPENQAQKAARRRHVAGNAQGISGWNFRFPKSGSTVRSEPISRMIRPPTIARTMMGSRLQAAFSLPSTTARSREQTRTTRPR